jgi:peptidyl-prolyl cis-trans isomerase C
LRIDPFSTPNHSVEESMQHQLRSLRNAPIAGTRSTISTLAILLLCAALASQLAGCDSPPPETAVARIGGEDVTVSELKAFAQSIPDGFHWDKTDAEAVSAMLDGLVDKKLLLMEVEARGLYADPHVAGKTAVFRRQEILRSFTRIKINEVVTITDEEIEERFLESRRNRSLRPGVIVLESMSDAREVIEELTGGANFNDIASTRSAEENTRSWGGDMGRYIHVDEADEYTRELFELEVGDVSEPVPVMHKRKRHYAVFKILDEVPVQLQEVETEVEQELFGEKRIVRSAVLADSLWNAHNGQIDTNVVSLVTARALKKGRNIEFSAAEAVDLKIATYGDGKSLTVREFLDTALEAKDAERAWQLADHSWVVSTVPGMILPQIMLAEAFELGLTEEADLIARVDNERQDLAVSRLRQLEVDRNIDATADEAKAYFEANPEKFMYSWTTTLWEVLLPSKETAEEVVRQLEGGADARAIIATYSTRAVHEEVRGQIELDRYSQAHYSGLYEHAQDVEEGGVGGPIKVPEGFSVFKVTAQVPARRKPFHDASKRRATAYVKIEKRKRGFVNFVKELRRRYDVEILADNIPALVVDGKLRTDVAAANEADGQPGSN